MMVVCKCGQLISEKENIRFKGMCVKCFMLEPIVKGKNHG